MIRKIITSGVTPAEKAALDAARELSIPHGGWTVAGAVSVSEAARYQLQPLPPGEGGDPVTRNLHSSDAGICFSRHRPEFVLKAAEAAQTAKRPFFEADLAAASAFEASRNVSMWLAENQVEVLFVTGPAGAPGDAGYENVKRVIKTVLYMDLAGDAAGVPLNLPNQPEPIAIRTVDQAVRHLMTALPFDVRTRVSRLTPGEAADPPEPLLQQLMNAFSARSMEPALLRACRDLAGDDTLSPRDAFIVIVRKVREALQQKSNVLRIIK